MFSVSLLKYWGGILYPHEDDFLLIQSDRGVGVVRGWIHREGNERNRWRWKGCRHQGVNANVERERLRPRHTGIIMMQCKLEVFAANERSCAGLWHNSNKTCLLNNTTRCFLRLYRSTDTRVSWSNWISDSYRFCLLAVAMLLSLSLLPRHQKHFHL